MLLSVRRNTECSQGADSDVLAQLLSVMATVKFTSPSLLERWGWGLSVTVLFVVTSSPHLSRAVS